MDIVYWWFMGLDSGYGFVVFYGVLQQMRYFYYVVVNQDYQCFVYLDWCGGLVILVDVYWNGVFLVSGFFKVFEFLFVGWYVVRVFFGEVDIGVVVVVKFVYLF